MRPTWGRLRREGVGAKEGETGASYRKRGRSRRRTYLLGLDAMGANWGGPEKKKHGKNEERKGGGRLLHFQNST